MEPMMEATMEPLESSGWREYKCKSGETLFFYNQETGEHRWSVDGGLHEAEAADLSSDDSAQIISSECPLPPTNAHSEQIRGHAGGNTMGTQTEPGQTFRSISTQTDTTPPIDTPMDDELPPGIDMGSQTDGELSTYTVHSKSQNGESPTYTDHAKSQTDGESPTYTDHGKSQNGESPTYTDHGKSQNGESPTYTDHAKTQTDGESPTYTDHVKTFTSTMVETDIHGVGANKTLETLFKSALSVCNLEGSSGDSRDESTGACAENSSSEDFEESQDTVFIVQGGISSMALDILSKGLQQQIQTASQPSNSSNIKTQDPMETEEVLRGTQEAQAIPRIDGFQEIHDDHMYAKRAALAGEEGRNGEDHSTMDDTTTEPQPIQQSQGSENSATGRPFTCSTCGRAFRLKHHLVKHYEMHTDARPYQCTKCGQTYKNTSALNRHAKQHTGIVYRSCPCCDQTFEKPKTFASHLKTHIGEQPYRCDQCDKRYDRQRSYRLHVMTHAGLRPHKCEICGTAFLTSDALTMHVRGHTKEKPYTCKAKGCKKTFNRRSSMNIHQRVHSEDRPHQCQVCDKRFKSRQSLRDHTRLHTGEKPFACTLCSKTYNRAHSLSIHMKLHFGKKAYPCTLCEKSFRRRQSLAFHMRLHTAELI